MSAPSSRMLPVPDRMPQRFFSIVDFPVPFEPTTAVTAPHRAEKEMSSRMGVSP